MTALRIGQSPWSYSFQPHAVQVQSSPRPRAQAAQPLRLPGSPSPEPPGSNLTALADFLRGHTSGGALMRRLHPPSEPKD